MTDKEQWERFDAIFQAHAREYINQLHVMEIIKTDFRIVYDMDLDEIFKRVN